MIHDVLPSVEAMIRLIGDYGNAMEYPDPDPEFGYDGAFANLAEHKSRCYVESKDGAEFEIVIRVDDDRSLDRWVYGDQGLEFHVLVDGHHMGKRLLSDYNFRDRRTWNTLFIGKKGPGADAYTAELRRFVFAPMTTIEDNTTDDEIKGARALGTIEVVVRLAEFRGHKTFGFGHGPSRRPTRPANDPGYPYSEISEKALKGRSLTHSTAYASAEQIPGNFHGGTRGPGPRKLLTATIDDGHPLISYLFKYRSYEGLKKETVIPRSPLPDYGTVVPKVEQLPSREIERLARQHLRQLKRDQNTQRVAASSGQRVKRNINDVYDLTEADYDAGRNSKAARLDYSNVDVIDLTQEEDSGYIDSYDENLENFDPLLNYGGDEPINYD